MTMAPQAAYPHLANFFGCWFHQDWIDDLRERGVPEVAESVVAQVFEEVPPSYVVELKRDLVRLDATGATPAIIREIIADSFHGNLRHTDDREFAAWWARLRDVIDVRPAALGVDPRGTSFAPAAVLASKPGPIEGPRLCIVTDTGVVIGRVMHRDGRAYDSTTALAVLVKDDSPDGYHIHTSYPI